MKELRFEAIDLLEENQEPFKLPKDAVVFSMHHGYEFNYFIVSEGDHPPIYQYVEGNGASQKIREDFDSFLLQEINITAQAIKDNILL